MFKKIWNDPVGSKIIAWAIIAALGLIAVQIQSYYCNNSFEETLINVLNFDFKLKYILLGVIAVVMLRWAYQFIFYNSKKPKPTKFQLIKKIDNYQDLEYGVKYTWTVGLGYNNKPYIRNLEYFCLRHDELPVKFMNGVCPMPKCENNNIKINRDFIKNHFESIVINEWNKLNS